MFNFTSNQATSVDHTCVYFAALAETGSFLVAPGGCVAESGRQKLTGGGPLQSGDDQ